MLGVDLIDYLLVKKVEEAKTSGTKDITKHPDYIKREVEFGKELKKKDDEWQKKLDEREKEIKKGQLFEKVSKRALANLKSRNPILPADPRKAQKWEETYIDELKKGNYMEDDDGEIIVLNAEGKTLTNDHGKPISFDDYEKDIADYYFEYPVAVPRSGSGNKPPKTGEGLGDQFKPPKTEDERLERLRDPKITPIQRKELTECIIK